MDNIQVSIVASAIRTKVWMKFYNSLKNNKINWEVIFVGDVKPTFELPENFKFIYSPTKPAQCYEIGFREAKGELIHWSADDAQYNAGQDFNLDKVYNKYKELGDYRNVMEPLTIENGKNITSIHRLTPKPTAPMMAPFGFMSRQLMDEIGGYDRRFISGQSENDLVMRAYEVGGKVVICDDAVVNVPHYEVHTHKDTLMRKWYPEDRAFLLPCWVTDKNEISMKRLIPLEPFEDKDILTVTQGAKGSW